MLRAVPWITDDAVSFLCGFEEGYRKRNGGKRPRILECGVGASTLFFADRSSAMISFEHDATWRAKIDAALSAFGINHVRTILGERPYSRLFASTIGAEKFDLIVIDGRDRVACLEESLRLGILASDGIIVLDNTERITGYGGRYGRMIELLSDGFDFVHFEQIGRDRAGWDPNHRWLTTIAWAKSGTPYTTKGLPL